jgi:hypothetical protein
MPTPTLVSRAVVRASVAAACVVLAGCATLHHEPPAEPVVTPSVVEAPPPAVAAAEPEPVPVPVPTPPPRARESAPRNIVVLFRPGTAGDAEVAAQIVAQLPAARYRASLVPIYTADSPELLAPLVALRPAIAVAVGRDAAAFARKHLAATPLVFCQVREHQEFLRTGQSVWGVSSMPPGTPADVARGVHSLLDRVGAGTTNGLPPLTPVSPISESKRKGNADVARTLGAPTASPALRAGD